MQQFGFGKGPVLRILNEAGVTRRPRMMTEEQIATAAQLYAEHWSTTKLGEHLGFDPAEPSRD
jgi:hypothetical protein